MTGDESTAPADTAVHHARPSGAPPIFRRTAVDRHARREVEPTPALDPPRWIALLWLGACAVGALALAIVR